MLNIVEVKRKLVEAALPSGFEKKVGEVLAELARPFVDEVYTDALGNVICHKKGEGKRLMMPAHMDTIGFIVTYIDDEGFVRFDGIGGHMPANLVGTPVRFENGLCGAIRLEKIGDLTAKTCSAIKMRDLYIDIGAKDAEEAKTHVNIGDVAVFDTKTVELCGGNVMTPYADDLISCVVLLLAMENLQGKQSKNDLYFVFSTQEEVGLRGPTTSAYHTHPYMGIAADLCPVGDTPSSTGKLAGRLGAGPPINIKDMSLICNPQEVAHMRKAAEQAGVAYQDEILTGGGTDSGAMQRARGGVYSGCISIPTRHIHSPGEIFNISDVEKAGELLAQCALNELE